MLKLYVVAVDPPILEGGVGTVNWYLVAQQAEEHYLDALENYPNDAVYCYEVIVPGQTEESLAIEGVSQTLTDLIDSLNWDHSPDELHLQTFNLVTGDYA